MGHRPGRGAVTGPSGILAADDEVDDVDEDAADVDSVDSVDAEGNVDAVVNVDAVGDVDAEDVNAGGSDRVDDEILVLDVDEDNLVGSFVV